MPETPQISPEIAAWRAAFGANLRSLREARGMTQEALAEGAGVDRKLIYRSELGQTSPRLDVLHALAIALKLQPRELLPEMRPVRPAGKTITKD